jgi:hypothetical protein
MYAVALKNIECMRLDCTMFTVEFYLHLQATDECFAGYEEAYGFECGYVRLDTAVPVVQCQWLAHGFKL